MAPPLTYNPGSSRTRYAAVQTDGRWTLAALTTALLLLYFTPWLALGHGVESSGLGLWIELPALLRPIDRFGIGEYAAPVLGWSIPLIGAVGVVQSARGRVSLCALALAASVFSLVAFGLWLSRWPQTPSLATLPLTHAGLAVVAGAVLVLGLNVLGALLRPRLEERLGISERRRRDGTVAIDVDRQRWRPLWRLLYSVANVAIVYVAAVLWTRYHLFELADRFALPVTAAMTVVIALAGLWVVRSALGRAPYARIVIDYDSLRVITGGERGRYARGHIGGLYVPQQAEDGVRDYYNAAPDAQTLTLPVTSSGSPTPQPGGLLRTPRASVMMRMRDRSVALAHHLRPAQAKELVRRLTIRLLD